MEATVEGHAHFADSSTLAESLRLAAGGQSDFPRLFEPHVGIEPVIHYCVVVLSRKRPYGTTSLLSIVCIVQDASTLWVDARYVLRMWSVGDGDEVIRDGWLGARFVPLYIVSADLAEGIMGEVVAPVVGCKLLICVRATQVSSLSKAIPGTS